MQDFDSTQNESHGRGAALIAPPLRVRFGVLTTIQTRESVIFTPGRTNPVSRPVLCLLCCCRDRSPIFSHFGETLEGVSTIRAFRKQPQFIKDNEERVDYNLQVLNTAHEAAWSEAIRDGGAG